MSRRLSAYRDDLVECPEKKICIRIRILFIVIVSVVRSFLKFSMTVLERVLFFCVYLSFISN